MQSGIQYFPLDCQLDEKFGLIEAEFGAKGFAIVVKLFQRIYGGKGYYCEWTKEVELLFSKSVGEGCNSVSEIVSASIKRGLFSGKMFEKYQILTSKGIQTRYFEAAKRRTNVKVKKEYLLLNCADIPKNVDISSLNDDISLKNADIFKQSRVEERRVKESRVEYVAAAPPSHTPHPTLEEVRGYCKEKSYHVNPEHFFSHYASVGWKLGNAPIVNWQAKIDDWEQRDRAGAPVQKPKTYDMEAFEKSGVFDAPMDGRP